MRQIIPYSCEHVGDVQINCTIDDGEPWFKATDIATALKYTDTDKAIRRHVANDDNRQQGSFGLNPAFSGGMKGNWKMAKCINESGLYC